MTRSEKVQNTFLKISESFAALAREADAVARAADMVTDCLRSGGTVFLCGNGGSAADAQHIAAELVGRFCLERPAYAAYALNTNVSTLTAIGNDYGYDALFERQIKGLGRSGDVLIGLSTSGNSRNVVAALRAAGEKGLRTLGMTGAKGGVMADICDLCLKAPSDDTPRIQEMHIAIGHLLCEMTEAALAAEATPDGSR